MQHFTKSFPLVSGLLIAVAVFGVFAARPTITSAEATKTADAAKATPSLEKMIKDIGLPYKTLESGKFLVAVTVGDGPTTNMIIGETAMGDDTIKMITLTSFIQDGTKDKKLSPAAMGIITDFDYQSDIGRVGVDKDNAVWYQSSLWESTATEETLTYEMAFAQANALKIQKKLKALTDEG